MLERVYGIYLAIRRSFQSIGPARGFSESRGRFVLAALTPSLSLGAGGRNTLIRAVREEDGTITNLEPPGYHGNPMDDKGSLVVTEWGSELCDFIYRSSSLPTTVLLIQDMRLGLACEFCEVLVSSKNTGVGGIGSQGS